MEVLHYLKELKGIFHFGTHDGTDVENACEVQIFGIKATNVMNTDTDLIKENFENFFREHYERLCSYAYSFLKDEHSCEDVVQETFIRVWEQKQELIGNHQLKFYLFTAVRNNCLTHLRKSKKHSFVELNDEDAPDEISLRLDEKERSYRPEELIQKGMEQLPPKCREVFMLSRLSHQTYQQIADSLGISVKTVENQMGKAIKILRKFARANNVYWALLLWLVGEKILYTI